MNGSGFVHGALMTFADYTIFAIAREALAGHGSVTVSTNSDFVDAGRAGQLHRVPRRGGGPERPWCSCAA